jgi:hypothetical protein
MRKFVVFVVYVFSIEGKSYEQRDTCKLLYLFLRNLSYAEIYSVKLIDSSPNYIFLSRQRNQLNVTLKKQQC